MLLGRNPIGSGKLGGTALLLAALFALSSTPARAQYPGIYPGAPGMVPPQAAASATVIPTPAAPATPQPPTEPNWHSYGIDQLLEHIVSLQQQRIYLERQQKEAESVLVQKIRMQHEQIRRLGIIDLEKAKATSASGNPK